MFLIDDVFSLTSGIKSYGLVGFFLSMLCDWNLI